MNEEGLSYDETLLKKAERYRRIKLIAGLTGFSFIATGGSGLGEVGYEAAHTELNNGRAALAVGIFLGSITIGGVCEVVAWRAKQKEAAFNNDYDARQPPPS